MPTYTTNDTGAQDGHINPGGTWNEGGALGVLAHSVAPQNWIGLQFLVPLTFDSEIGVPLAPQGFSSMVLTLKPEGPGGPITASDPGDLTPYVVPESAPAPYSDALLPGSRNEVVAGDVVAVADGDITDQTLTIDIGVLAPYIGRSTWRGIVSLSILWTPDSSGSPARTWGSSTSGNSIPDIETVEFAFNTGHHGSFGGRRGRAVNDYTTGKPYLSDEAVADGFSEGVMVHPDSWDPIDPRPTYVPPAGEGSADDEVTSLE